MKRLLKCPTCESMLMPQIITGVTLDQCPNAVGSGWMMAKWPRCYADFPNCRKYRSLTSLSCFFASNHLTPTQKVVDHGAVSSWTMLTMPIVRTFGRIAVPPTPENCPAMVPSEKDNPKLDRLAAVTGDHVRGMEKRRGLAKELYDLAPDAAMHALQMPNALLAWVSVETFRRFNRQD